MTLRYDDYVPQIPTRFWGDDELEIWTSGLNARLAYLYNTNTRAYQLDHPRFGLVMDGVTDDTVAFQAAVDWVEDQGGGRLEIPPNVTILITDAIELPRSPTVDLVGWGRFSVIKNTGTTYAIKFADDAVNVASKFDIGHFRIDCTGGGACGGVYLNNSRSTANLTGTISVTNGFKDVVGSGTAFLTELDLNRDSLVIDGVEYDIRTGGGVGFDNNTLQLASNYEGATASGLTIQRARYGGGSRWGEVHHLWVQCDDPPEAPADPTDGSFGIRMERGNNVTFRTVLIRGMNTGFRAEASVNGRSAGCYMEMVIVANSVTYGYYFNDSRAFAMKRCRSEGDPAIAWYMKLGEAHLFDQCSAEDDHATAGWYLEDCKRLQGNINIGTNFGGGVGVWMDNCDNCTFWAGQASWQSLRSTLLSRGSTDTNVATPEFEYWINETKYTKTAVAAGTAFSAQTVPADTYAIYRASINASGTITLSPGAANATTGYASAALAEAARPTLPAANIDLGYLILKTAVGQPWIAGTDALAGGASGNPASETTYYECDLIRPSIYVDSASQSNEFWRISVENALTGGIANASATSDVNYLDTDNTRAGIIAPNIPTRQHQKTYTTGSHSLSQYDAGSILIDNSGGAVTLALPNVTAQDTTTGVASTLGLRFAFYVLGSSANTVTIQRAGSDVVDDVTSAGSANSFTMVSGECVVLEATEAGRWKFIGRRKKAVAISAALTDSTGGTAGNTLSALPTLTDSPASADALRDDIVTNLVPAIHNLIASLAAKVADHRAALRHHNLMD